MPSAKATPASPPPLSARVVPAVLGKGRVNLYDARAGLPALVNEPPGGAEFFEKVRYVLVHLPSRRWYASRSKRATLSILDEVKAGKGTEIVKMLVQSDEKPPARDRAHTKQKPVLTPPEAKSPPTPDAAPGEQEKPKDAKDSEKPGWTPVPEGLDFDKAMKLVFPVQRITGQLEELLTASTPIYSDGEYCGDSPAHQTRLQALKTLIEYHVGKAHEREKAKEVKPPLTLQEIRAKMVMSDEYRAGIVEMAADCEREAAARKALKPA